MKFFVTGVNGQLGHDVMNELAKEDMRVLDRKRFIIAWIADPQLL